MIVNSEITDQTILSEIYKNVLDKKPNTLNGLMFDFTVRYEF
jgi:hypothetical protein